MTSLKKIHKRNCEMTNSARYYIVATFALVILAKLIFKTLDNYTLQWLLRPVVAILEVTLDMKSICDSQGKYVFQSTAISIDKSCSGFTFLCLASIIVSMANATKVLKTLDALKHWMLAICIAYCITILVNTWRLTVLIEFNDVFHAISFVSYHILHKAIGSFIYFSFLIMLHLSLLYRNKIKNTIFHHLIH